VAEDDVAEAVVRLAMMDAPPSTVEFGGPEALTRHQVVDAFERATGARFRRVSVPRALLSGGSHAMRRIKPEVASVLGMALAMDVEGCDPPADPLRKLGIEPRSASDAIREMAGTPAHAA
jgi:NADH dehydrogenase